MPPKLAGRAVGPLMSPPCSVQGSKIACVPLRAHGGKLVELVQAVRGYDSV